MARRTRVASVVALLGVGLLFGRCASDRPSPTGITANLTKPPKPTGLLQCSPVPLTTVKQTVGPAGGTLLIGPHVFVVPPGALAVPVTIQAKLASSTGNAIEFKPAGLVFLTPASVTLSYANCNTLGLTYSKQVAYTTDSLTVVYYVSSQDDPSAQRVTGRVDHFSDFAVAW